MSPRILPELSRRNLLRGTSAALAAAIFAREGMQDALARAPMLNTQAPAYHRFKIGTIEATVISDGPLMLGAPSAGVFDGLSKEDLEKALATNFLPVDNLALEQNALVLNTGDKLALIDTGLGTSKMMGDKSGRLLTTLKSAGIDPKDIDAVIVTHAHPDHCWALLGDNGAPNFPNAQIYLSQADFDFWTDPGKLSVDAIKGMVDGTRKQLLPLRERIQFVKDGQEVVPGVQAMAAPGHTVGHMVYMIASAGKTFCNIADIAHHQVVSLEKPRFAFAFDTDGQQGVNTRIRFFDMLAAQRIPILAYHFSWPGLGYVAKQGDAYRYAPAQLQMAL